jgi:hypothetical protein
MPKGLRQVVKDNLEKCRAAAIAAVDVYNRPGPRFRTAHFIVLIAMAWTAFFHAVFFRKNIKPFYKRRGKNPRGDRYVQVDGEPKHWDLSECLKQYFGGENPPERKNLEFLIGLRNKIEHRNLPELDAGLYGECQAALLNLEELLTSEFGAKYALAEQLAVSLQFTQLIPLEKTKAVKRLVGAAKSVKEYVEDFRAGLPSPTLNSTKYCFSVFLVPRVANKKELADAAVEFVKFDEVDEGARDRLEKLNVLIKLIKEKHIPIANLGLYRPGEVVNTIKMALPHKFSMADHTAAWKHFRVRPDRKVDKSKAPEGTNPIYCVYDKAHNDYLYTAAWVEKLKTEMADREMFEQITGRQPISKSS